MGECRPLTPQQQQQQLWRWRILVSSYFGYTGFYLVRKVFTMCKSTLALPTEEGGYGMGFEAVAAINRKLNGWSNHFSLGPVSNAYRAVDSHVNRRLRRWLCKKHKVPGTGISRFPDDHLYQSLGLVRLSVTKRNFSRANA